MKAMPDNIWNVCWVGSWFYFVVNSVQYIFLIDLHLIQSRLQNFLLLVRWTHFFFCFSLKHDALLMYPFLLRSTESRTYGLDLPTLYPRLGYYGNVQSSGGRHPVAANPCVRDACRSIQHDRAVMETITESIINYYNQKRVSITTRSCKTNVLFERWDHYIMCPPGIKRRNLFSILTRNPWATGGIVAERALSF